MSEAGGVEQSAQELAYAWLKQHVVTVPRSEGAFLTEAHVAKESGTSRTPVREALLRMEAEGFLQILPKKGAFVPPISDAELDAVMQARALIEDWCIRQVAAAPDAVVDRLNRLLAEQDELLSDPIAFIECDRAFHRTIVSAAGNTVLAEFYESLRERQVRMGLRAVADAPERARTVVNEHAAIVAGLSSGDARRATSALGAHLDETLAAIRSPVIASGFLRTSTTD